MKALELASGSASRFPKNIAVVLMSFHQSEYSAPLAAALCAFAGSRPCGSLFLYGMAAGRNDVGL
ncbi:hypothetical protein [Erythrobacter tepidarius]|uniref:hypothetical protein n=1 Tax=Erythrobacter tepidarius TaxID=60454 RepID=UPI00117EEED2|nr:hypothetical protein [Erythrobacter tepidarius]